MSLLDMQVDRSTPIPLYYQLKQLILKEIESGHYKVGENIPTEMQLVDHFQISRSTVRQAIKELVSEGYLKREASNGTTVTKPDNSSESFIRSFEPFYQQIRRQNKTPRTELLQLNVIDPDAHLRGKMELGPTDKVISMFRRRSADDTPMVLIQNFMPYSLCSFILSEDFTVRSLYELLMSHPETTIENTQSRISAELQTEEDQKLLQLDSDVPMLCFHNIARRSDGVILDYAFSRYRGDLNKFVLIDKPNLHPGY
ncbi:GntR family transcriptional regulator [Porcincola intestinalis]|uniref:GntR family transcriptional regulator n=1 Tax=Porcincola intestinalis TaxID=2606632 RepID=UPI002A7F7A5E|nr:GntR family transcriptional regulator [Porcincola intestinalis]MDY4203799.1 GntR family transcriptional regulator [Porcincola intestinalis]